VTSPGGANLAKSGAGRGGQQPTPFSSPLFFTLPLRREPRPAACSPDASVWLWDVEEKQRFGRTKRRPALRETSFGIGKSARAVGRVR
jgi:hypothetical protein